MKHFIDGIAMAFICWYSHYDGWWDDTPHLALASLIAVAWAFGGWLADQVQWKRE